MPRQSSFKKQEPVHNALIASAENYTGIQDVKKPSSGKIGWQSQSWAFYDTVGEFEYIANWTGNMWSKARLYPTVDGKEVKDGPVFEAFEELHGGPQGRSAALRLYGIQDAVAGESWTFSYTEGGVEKWLVVPSQQVSKLPTGQWRVGELTLGNPLAIRTWQPHPFDPSLPNSAARAALSTLNEIQRLTQHIESQVLSRLLSAGLLLIPNEAAFSSSAESTGEKQSNISKADEFIKEFYAAASAAIRDPGSASAQIPMVMTADGDILDKPRLLEFWSELDQHAIEMRQEAIRRLALALDVPPEILTGTGDVSHWQAWGVDEASIKAHMEPGLNRIAADLTTGFLRPAVAGAVTNLESIEIHVDTTGLRVRPNRSREAIELYNNGELSADAMRRENGFTDDDKPSDKERDEFRYWTLAKSSVDSAMSSQAAAHIGLDLKPAGEGSEGNDTQPSPSIEDHPDRTAVPSQEEQKDLQKDAERKAQQAALVAASEQMVFRALERGGNKAKNQLKMTAREGVEPSELYLFNRITDAEASFMLDGAFTHVSRFAPKMGVNADYLTATLEQYCRGLLTESLPHSTERLSAHLSMEKANA